MLGSLITRFFEHFINRILYWLFSESKHELCKGVTTSRKIDFLINKMEQQEKCVKNKTAYLRGHFWNTVFVWMELLLWGLGSLNAENGIWGAFRWLYKQLISSEQLIISIVIWTWTKRNNKSDLKKTENCQKFQWKKGD